MAVIRTLLSLYIFILIADSILSFFPDFNSKEWRKKIKMMADFTCDPIRKKIPETNLPIDISPLIVIIIIQLFEYLW
jgi:YggT family protein